MSREGSEVNGFLALFDWIGVLARRRYHTAERYFSVLGLNHTEARLLTLLRQQAGEATQDVLSNGLTVDRSNAVRALQRLEQDGYILRRKQDADQRAKVVQITPKGRKAVAQISKLKKKMAQSFFGALKENEAAEIVDLLGKAFANEPHATMPGRQGSDRPVSSSRSRRRALKMEVR